MFRHKNKGVVYNALIDIGSGTVGVGIMESKKDADLPKLIYAHRSTMRVTEHKSSLDIDFRRVHEALISTALLLSQEGYKVLRERSSHARISNLYVTCSSPWAYTLVRNVRYENEKPFKITQSILDDLIETAESSILEHLKEDKGQNIDSFEVIERTTVDITVNDYHIVNPINADGTIVALSHVAGVIPKEIIHSIQEVQHKLFPEIELKLHTSILAMYCVVREIFPRLTNYAIFDVTGEVTECAIVENNSFVENTYISSGSISFVRELMQKTGRPLGDIQTNLSAYEEGDGVPDEFVENIKMYEEKVKEMIVRTLKQRIFPSHIIVTAHRPYTDFFARIIKNAIENTITDEPTLFFIEPSLIDSVLEGTGEDAYLALYARFFHKVHSCGEPNQP